MSAQEGFGALSEMWRYHLLRTVYAPLRLGLLIVGSMHTLISSAAFSIIHLESTRMDIQAYLVDFCV